MHWLIAILVLPYFLILLNIYRSLLKIKTYRISTESGTFISVVVACRNEQENLPVLLYNIACQDYPKELFEVIIVDDNSTDRTFETASGFTGIDNILAIRNNGHGKKAAVETGINASSGSLIITTDGDCRIGRNWLRTIAAFYEEHKPDMIICPVQIESGSGFFGRFQELEFLSLQGLTAGSALSGDPVMCNGANLAFTPEVYHDHSQNLHFEIASGDDIFLLYSLKKQNRSKIFWLESPESIVTTAPSPSIWSFLKQRKRWISKARSLQ